MSLKVPVIVEDNPDTSRSYLGETKEKSLTKEGKKTCMITEVRMWCSRSLQVTTTGSERKLMERMRQV